MIRTNCTLLLAACAVFASAPAVAQDGGFSVGVTGGSLGIGPEVGYRMSETLAVRANATFFNFSRSVDSDDIVYDGDLKLQSFGAMVDLHPFGSGFRISAGARISDNGVDLAATPTQLVEVGDEDYTPSEIGTLSGKVETNGFAPTATIGWGGGLTKGLKLGVDIGVMLQGSPTIENLSATGTLRNDPDFLASLADEEIEIEEDIDFLKLYPIVQLSIGYRF